MHLQSGQHMYTFCCPCGCHLAGCTLALQLLMICTACPSGPQVLADRGETGSKFGRATFSVLLLQDLAVVVLLMLIPLLAPSPDGAAGASALAMSLLDAACDGAPGCVMCFLCTRVI
jgi:Kef-type K+ transport system membrane component KefB